MILSCSNISKAFGTEEILKHVSFHVEDHEKAAIVGINGAGKSTLLKIIVGELAADEGSVTIAMDGDDLCIRDTGMGIAPEDLPRIFDRGFTGLNGRRDTRASGIGLYLCRRICRSLGHTIRASSVPNQGTEIRIGLGQKKTLPE